MNILYNDISNKVKNGTYVFNVGITYYDFITSNAEN